jgi:predicted lactoylglutathione lyase
MELIDHIHLVVTDLEVSKRFYSAVLNSLGCYLTEDDEHFYSDELWVSAGDQTSSKVHLAFQACSPAAVERFYQAALAAGGQDYSSPGEIPARPGCYIARVSDPDGNKIEAVYRAPTFHRMAVGAIAA